MEGLENCINTKEKRMYYAIIYDKGKLGQGNTEKAY